MARDQRTLFQLIFWVAAFVFIVVEGALVVTFIRFRKKPTEQALPKQTHGNTPLEIAWTIVPVALLIIVMVPTVTTIFAQAKDPVNAVQVKATGHQWWFEFEYPELGITTANELRVPVGRPINVVLESDDVIHSFWVPKLAGKTDLVPNHPNQMWFQADEPGLYYGQCAEFCGTAHALMRFRVIAEGQQEFDQWAAGQIAPPAAAMIPEFGIKGCAVCHTVNGPDAEGVQDRRAEGFRNGAPQFPAPNLTHFASRSTFAGGIVDRTDENLRRWIRDPDDVKPGNRMKELAGAYHNPNQSLSDDDVNVLVDYLQSLQ